MGSHEGHDVADLRFAADECPSLASRRLLLAGRVGGLSLISSVAAFDLVPLPVLGAMAVVACGLGAYEVHRGVAPWPLGHRRPVPRGQVARL